MNKTLFLLILAVCTMCCGQDPDRAAIEEARKQKRIAARERDRLERYEKIAIIQAASFRRRANRDYLDAARRSYFAASNAAQFGIATQSRTYYPPAAVYTRGSRYSSSCARSRYSCYDHYRY